MKANGLFKAVRIARNMEPEPNVLTRTMEPLAAF